MARRDFLQSGGQLASCVLAAGLLDERAPPPPLPCKPEGKKEEEEEALEGANDEL